MLGSQVSRKKAPKRYTGDHFLNCQEKQLPNAIQVFTFHTLPIPLSKNVPKRYTGGHFLNYQKEQLPNAIQVFTFAGFPGFLEKQLPNAIQVITFKLSKENSSQTLYRCSLLGIFQCNCRKRYTYRWSLFLCSGTQFRVLELGFQVLEPEWIVSS